MANKLLKKIVGALDYKLVEKNLIKNNRLVNSKSILNLNLILKKIFDSQKIECLIQIGANDGNRFDELNPDVNPNSKYNPNKFTEYGEAKSVKQNANTKDGLVVDNNNDLQTSTGSYSVKNKNRNKLITAGRDEWIERTKNSPAASFLEPEERWQQQLKHREWLRINNRI